MVDELCFLQGPNGHRCTLPKGHSGDHIAESVRKGNIVGAFREDQGRDVSIKPIKVKGGNCAVLAVILLGGLSAMVAGLVEAIRHIA